MDGPVGVRFTEAGPLSYCSPGDLQVGLGDYVVVRTPRGERLGWVVLTPDQVLVSEPEGPLRVIERLASEADVQAWQQQRKRAEEEIGRAQALATRTDPRVRVASLVYDLAGGIADLTFSAPERKDVEWLRRQWAELLEVDLDVQQVGDRDRAKAIGGLGVCGLALCCSTWMTEFPAISMKMAKEQDLPPNPSKISGVCGRLLCCLAFEVDQYRELRGDLPKVGRKVSTPVGRAKVLSVNALKQVVRLRIEATGEVIEIDADELRAQYGAAVRPVEIEEQLEAPIKERDRRLQETFLAPIEAVTHAPARAAATAVPEREAEAGDGGEDSPRRRRRGRRGGRRRRRSGEGTSAAEPGNGDDSGDDGADDDAD